ncbi:MAG: radical SAM protein [bacterium]
MKQKRKIVFCGVEEPLDVSPERYGLALSYPFEYLAAFALQNKEIAGNFEFETLLANRNAFDEDIIFDIAARNPRMAGFSCSVKNIGRCLRIARQLKLACPETLIILGGPEMYAAERLMQKHSFIDLAVFGEGEETFSETLLSVLAGETGKIPGLFRRAGGKIVSGGPRKPIERLDSIPSFFTPEKAAAVSGIALYETARGCPNKCSYCLWSPYSKRYFSMKRVKREIGLLLENDDIERIWFIDSDFDSDVERSKEILRFVKKKRKPGLELSAFLNFHTPDEELLALVAELFHEVPVGIQTVKRNLQKNIGRDWFDIAEFEKNLGKILSFIPAHKLYIDLMYGLPGEKPGDFADTLMWCLARGLTHINFFRLSVFPGAPLEKIARKSGLIFDPEPPHLVYSSDTFSFDDLIAIETEIVNYKVLETLLPPESLSKLAASDAFTDILRNLSRCDPDFETRFVCINESNISDIDIRKLAAPVTEFLRKYKIDKEILDSARSRR